jgi:hypothetical protein
MLLARVLDVPSEIVHAHGYRLSKGIGLGPKMGIERTAGNGGFLGKAIDGRAVEPLPAEDPPCASQDLGPGLLPFSTGSVCHARPQSCQRKFQT